MKNDPMLTWEDFTIGRAWSHGFYIVTEAEIVSFAELYDPLAMHLDPALARETPLGIFCASGIHTLAIAQRSLCDALLKNTRVVAGGGMDKVRMRAPVVPGDKLQVRMQVGKTWLHPRNPACAWITMLVDILRHDDCVVMDYQLTVLVQRAKSS